MVGGPRTAGRCAPDLPALSVLAYLPDQDRRAFAATVGALDATGISNEPPWGQPGGVPERTGEWPPATLALCQDGVPRAEAGVVGDRLIWF